MSFELIANVIIAGLLTGLVYGLMALGLSVIFGVVRVVNFAHGELMTVAMYAATLLFAHAGLDPFLAVGPVVPRPLSQYSEIHRDIEPDAADP